MFLLPTFPLVDQIKTHFIIWKLIDLGFRYSFCLLLLNGLICIFKTSNIFIKKVLNRKIVDSKIYQFWSTLVCNHPSTKIWIYNTSMYVCAKEYNQNSNLQHWLFYHPLPTFIQNFVQFYLSSNCFFQL
jgi:hypothetical protein